MLSLNQLLKLLPHQYPLRLVDEITEYKKGDYIYSKFTPEPFKKVYGDLEFIPENCLIEGLAQSAVIFTQMETKPLSKNEHPLLGGVKSNIYRKAHWNEKITYYIKPVRIIEKKAILSGEIYGNNQNVILSADLSVSVSI